MPKFATPEDELKSIAEELEKDLDRIQHFPKLRHEAIMRAFRKAADVGHRTTTTDDWVHLWD